jgi:cell wall-associated NlpC family hydrolase
VRWRGGALARAVVLLAFAASGLVLLAPPALAASPTATPVSTCATLGPGTTGAAVAAIQTLVGATADGDFGPQTAAALSKWQTAEDIPATGVVDAATWAVMPAATAAAACAEQITGTGFTVGCAVLSEGDTGPAVAVLEAALQQPVDGEFSAQLGQALTTAQQAASLPGNATTDRATWKALKLTGTPVCTPGSTTPALPKDYKAQQKVRNEVAQLAATLLEQPGTTTNKIALAAIAFAKAQIGKPYVYGAAGPNAYDCSGLQMASYLSAGLTLPRVAASQYTGSGPTVPLDQAQAGDLLFFASDVTKPATIYHVAMYVGGGQVLDAPHTGAKVGIRQLWITDLLPVVVRPTAALVLPLRSGATGWSVMQLQQVLDRAGAQLTVDGGYGPATKAAVAAWQQAHQLAANGVVRLSTWLSLIAPPAPPASASGSGTQTPPGGSASQ